MKSVVRAAVAALLGITTVAPEWAMADGSGPPVAAGDLRLADSDGGAGTGNLDTLIVLGTKSKDTTELTSTAPVSVITTEQLQQTGAVTLNEALSKLEPSFNFPQGQNAVKGQGIRAASLRGVGPAYTLVLVNGKRRNLSALLANTDPWPAAQVVDINAIPVSAVDHIEVLADGAAAQYGSDAIAGVINIVLKKTAAGGDITARLGGYTDGGGQTQDYKATKGLTLGDGGFVNFSVQRLYNANVDRSAGDWRQLFPTGDERNTTYPKDYGQWGQAGRDNWSGLINGELPLSGSWTAYGWLNYADEATHDYVNPERIVASNTQSATATIPNQLSPTDVLGIYPNGYQPWMKYTSKEWDAVGGARYSDPGLGDLDAAVSYGTDTVGRNTYNTVNPSWGPQSPTSFYLGSWKSRTTSITVDYSKSLPLSFLDSAVVSAGGLYRDEHWGTADLGDYIGYTSGPLGGQALASLYGPGGIYNQYASQYPTVNFVGTTAVVPATGSSTVGIEPIDAGSITRTVKGGYVGFDAKVIRQLDVGVTGRYEDYSDFGSTTNYRFTARYEIIPAIALRGTLSSGFHAPSLAEVDQQSTGYTSTFSNNGISILTPGHTLQFRSEDPWAAAFGAKALKPEKSNTASVGLVLRPDPTSSITIDAYNLRIDNVITTTQTLQGSNITAAFNAAGLAGYTQTTYYLNAWDSRTRGIDIVAKKEFDLGQGLLDVSAAVSFLNTEVFNVVGAATVNGVPNSNVLIGPSQVRDAETGVPKNKDIVDISYKVAKWTVDATETRYSSYRYNVGPVPFVATANGNIDQVFNPEVYLDFSVDYQVQESLRLGVRVQNVFDRYPDKYVLGNRSSGINPYSFIAPNGASGRFVDVEATYSFK